MESGRKNDSAKPRMSLVPTKALVKVAEVMTYGADKYEAYNWAKGLNHSRLMDATLRHLYSHMNGDDLDEETNLPHLAHAAASILMLLETFLNRPDLDDIKSRRFLPPKQEDLSGDLEPVPVNPESGVQKYSLRPRHQTEDSLPSNGELSQPVPNSQG